MQTIEILPELKGYNVEKEKRKIVSVLRKVMNPCKSCGQCLINCKFHDYSEKDARYIMEEVKEYVFSKNLNKKLSKKVKNFIWNCGICEHCNLYCPLSIDKKMPRSVWIVLLRATLVKNGQAPLVIKIMNKFFRDIHNPILKYIWPIMAKLNVPDWYITKNPIHVKIRDAIEKARKIPKKGAEICFFGGCGHTWGSPDVVYQMISILKESKVDFITIGNSDYCCGTPYAILGFYDVWMDQMNRLLINYLKLKPRPKTLLLQCPGCTTIHMFDMSKYGVDLPLDYLRKMPNGVEMQHVTEYALTLVKEGKINLKNPIPMTVTYNDNCSIGRRLELVGRPIYDEPRELLNSIPEIKLIESDYIRENAFCCGSMARNSPKKYEVYEELYKNILEKGSDILLTPCMGCVSSFKKGANRLGNKLKHKILIMDILHLVNRSLGNEIPKRQKMTKGSIIKKIIKTGAYKDIYRLIKETLIYMLFPKKYNPHKYDKNQR